MQNVSEFFCRFCRKSGRTTPRRPRSDHVPTAFPDRPLVDAVLPLSSARLAPAPRRRSVVPFCYPPSSTARSVDAARCALAPTPADTANITLRPRRVNIHLLEKVRQPTAIFLRPQCVHPSQVTARTSGFSKRNINTSRADVLYLQKVKRHAADPLVTRRNNRIYKLLTNTHPAYEKAKSVPSAPRGRRWLLHLLRFAYERIGLLFLLT